MTLLWTLEHPVRQSQSTLALEAAERISLHACVLARGVNLHHYRLTWPDL